MSLAHHLAIRGQRLSQESFSLSGCPPLAQTLPEVGLDHGDIRMCVALGTAMHGQCLSVKRLRLRVLTELLECLGEIVEARGKSRVIAVEQLSLHLDHLAKHRCGFELLSDSQQENR